METHFQKTAGLLGNPHLYSTSSVCRIDAESDEMDEALYDEAAQYRGDFARSMERRLRITGTAERTGADTGARRRNADRQTVFSANGR